MTGLQERISAYMDCPITGSRRTVRRRQPYCLDMPTLRKSRSERQQGCLETAGSNRNVQKEERESLEFPALAL